MNLLLLNLSLHKNLAVINHMNKKNILKKSPTNHFTVSNLKTNLTCFFFQRFFLSMLRGSPSSYINKLRF